MEDWDLTCRLLIGVVGRDQYSKVEVSALLRAVTWHLACNEKYSMVGLRDTELTRSTERSRGCSRGNSHWVESRSSDAFFNFCTHYFCPCPCLSMYTYRYTMHTYINTYRQTDRQTDRQMCELACCLQASWTGEAGAAV